MNAFRISTDFTLRGDQPRAVSSLVEGLDKGIRDQVLLGVTGSGKTFTMANVIARAGRPALVIAPNKTLAAQLYGEFKLLFPDNAVGYFVSYYDYYQPEAYLPGTDTYIEKDTDVNEQIDRMRHAATYSLWTRKDVIIVASVSCIYGLGSPQEYHRMVVEIRVGEEKPRDELLRELVEIYYERNDVDFHRGTFRVRGDVVEIFPAYEEYEAVRIEFWGNTIEKISLIDPLRGRKLKQLESIEVFPGSHYVTTQSNLRQALRSIEAELGKRLEHFRSRGDLLAAQRLEQRTNYDLEMLRETGFCTGIENYSRHLDNRRPGEPPATLLDYFPADFLLFIDESHLTVPQIRGMYRGDRSRKQTLVDYGFRLPSALDNRPLNFREFDARVNRVIYVSATPAEYEREKSRGRVVEQLIRPTGLIDPAIEVRDARFQVDDLLGEIKKRLKKGERVLVTTLTKRLAEDLAEYYEETGLKVKYLHSDIDTITRTEIIRDLRLGKFDVLVGINLLREGLDLPEVSLVAILDADREGFLRSARSLIQTCGRASRNVNGRVIMYAYEMTESMKQAISETGRRRKKQKAFNRARGITPSSIKKNISNVLSSIYEADYVTVGRISEEEADYVVPQNLAEEIKRLEKEMRELASDLRFEEAAAVRDRLQLLQEKQLGFQPSAASGVNKRGLR